MLARFKLLAFFVIAKSKIVYWYMYSILIDNKCENTVKYIISFISLPALDSFGLYDRFLYYQIPKSRLLLREEELTLSH